MLPQRFFLNHFTLNYESIQKGYYHTLLTYALPHHGIGHLISNLLPTFFFGKIIEMYFGSRTLLTLYLGGILLGGIFINKYNAEKKNIPMRHLGSSAGTSALILFFIMNYPFA